MVKGLCHAQLQVNESRDKTVRSIIECLSKLQVVQYDDRKLVMRVRCHPLIAFVKFRARRTQWYESTRLLDRATVPKQGEIRDDLHQQQGEDDQPSTVFPRCSHSKEANESRDGTETVAMHQAPRSSYGSETRRNP